MTAAAATIKPGTSQVQEDNGRVRITRWHLPPQSETGHHRHEYDYAIVPITDGTLTITEGGGQGGKQNDGITQKESPLSPGTSYFRPAGVEHNVQNLTPNDIIFVEVEIK